MPYKRSTELDDITGPGPADPSVTILGQTIPVSDWHGLYKDSWQGTIAPAAFAHPAKFAKGLILQTVAHLVGHGWITTDDLVGDPFAGVGLGAWPVMLAGCRWIGVEVEAKFVQLADQNLDLWLGMLRQAYPDHPGRGMMLWGDSRQFASLIQDRRLGAVVSSPPYADTLTGSDGPSDRDRQHRIDIGRDPDSPGSHNLHGYSLDPSNMGNQRGTDAGLAAVLSSPPYRSGGKHYDQTGAWGGKDPTRPWSQDLPKDVAAYGDTQGQMGKMPDVDFWTSARQVIDQLIQVLRPGGHVVWITKRFVRDGRVGQYSAQWAAVSIAAGLQPVCWHRAWLVDDRGTQVDLQGKHHRRLVHHKSFYRRLAEGRGSPPIDWEDVVCFVRPETHHQ